MFYCGRQKGYTSKIMGGSERPKTYYVEEADLVIEIDENDSLVTFCADCQKVLYTASEINNTTLAVAEMISSGHSSAYTPCHWVGTTRISEAL